MPKPDAIVIGAVDALGGVPKPEVACADRNRDPESLRICHPIVTAPEPDDFTTRAYAHAVTYLEWPGHGEALTDSNGWDQSVHFPDEAERVIHEHLDVAVIPIAGQRWGGARRALIVPMPPRWWWRVFLPGRTMWWST
jgi:hypothetical protein